MSERLLSSISLKTYEIKSFTYIGDITFHQALFISKGVRCNQEKEKQILECELKYYVNFCLRMDHD